MKKDYNEDYQRCKKWGPLEVTVVLRSQQQQKDGKWILHTPMHGKNTIVANRIVKWFSEHPEEALRRVKLEELESIKVKWERFKDNDTIKLT